MKLIITNSKGRQRTLHIPTLWLGAIATAVVSAPVALGAAGYFAVSHFHKPVIDKDITTAWQAQIDEQRDQLTSVNDEAETNLRALTVRLADMQTQLLRIDALGERLVDVAGIDSDEFDFNVAPAVGGPASPDVDMGDFQMPDFSDAVSELDSTLQRRESQLEILHSLIDNQLMDDRTAVAGRPIRKGYLSSRFGKRTDPFTGKVAYHKGVDFAAPDGSDVIATGAGVVTYAGHRWGYGNLVEINHGKGITTRYAHLKKPVAKKGDIVESGDVIAIVGSTGRSTGPHVHYEVLKNDQQINPHTYIAKARP